MPNSAADLNSARRNRDDEFYTQRTDIEKEMKHYKPHFQDQTIFCNCDDPETSEFYKFFKDQFQFYGLKKLIATHYNYDSTVSTYRLDYDGKDETKTPLQFNGDFSSPECEAILADEADIVITNPPFSQWRPYAKQIMDFNRKFIIMGNINVVTCKEVRPWFTNGDMWLGCSLSGQKPEFRVPDDYGHTATDANLRIEADGTKYIKVQGVRWFTNLTHARLNQSLPLSCKYDPDSYPAYDNYNAIEVSKNRKIPADYDGEMGVPITFLDKFNPNQFEFIGFDSDLSKTDGRGQRFKLNGKTKYARIVIRKK